MLQKASTRANLTASISPTLDVSVTSSFVKLDQRLPQVDNNVNSYFFNAMTGPGLRLQSPASIAESIRSVSRSSATPVTARATSFSS